MICKCRNLQAIGAFCFAIALCPSVRATTVRIRAMYPDNEGLAKVLVIVKSLEGERKEFARELSGADGFTSPLELAPGFYEAIATYPYGDIVTQVKDFAVTTEISIVEIPFNVESDHKINLNEIDWRVRVLDQHGRPAANALVIGRNAEASTGASVAKTDEHGFASVSVPVGGALIIVLYHGETWSEPAYTETGAVVDCQNRCLLRAKAALQRRRPLSKIKFPF